MILQEDKLEFEFFIILLLDDGTIVLERDNIQYLKKDILNSGKKVEKVLDYCLALQVAISTSLVALLHMCAAEVFMLNADLISYLFASVERELSEL